MPPPNSKAYAATSNAISNTMPTILPDLKPLPDFAPHVTLTSEVPPSLVESDPQKWLDELELKHCEDVHVRFKSLVTEDKFFKRLFIRCEKDPGLFCVAKSCRKWGVEGGDHAKAGKWLNGSYDPHCSLMYSGATVSDDMMDLVKRRCDGIALEETGAKNIEEEPVIGWIGGEIWLVPTEGRDIKDWKPVARRKV